MTNCEWCKSYEGVLFIVTLWVSLCCNLTILYGLENKLLAKHFSATITMSVFIVDILFLLTQMQKIKCTVSKIQRTMLYGLNTAVYLAALIAIICGHEELDGIPKFAVVELAIICIVFAILAVTRYIQIADKCPKFWKRSQSEEYEPGLEICVVEDPSAVRVTSMKPTGSGVIVIPEKETESKNPFDRNDESNECSPLNNTTDVNVNVQNDAATNKAEDGHSSDHTFDEASRPRTPSQSHNSSRAHSSSFEEIKNVTSENQEGEQTAENEKNQTEVSIPLESLNTEKQNETLPEEVKLDESKIDA